MQLSPEQVLALATDPASAAAGKKLANGRSWQRLGQSAEAMWGECQGSALYQVRVDLHDLAVRCSCPSRKFPCKHGLGLMLLAATTPTAFPQAAPPDWVAEWLQKRSATQAARETKTKTGDGEPAADTAAQAKRADAVREKRLALVARGLDGLDLWMNDLVRNGLAGLELQPASFWDKQAARMVDAQAQGIAARLRAMGGIPNASPDWPERLLGELGRLALLTHAFRRLDRLDPALQEDVRQAIGWTLKEDEVSARGEVVDDDWLVLGQRISGEDHLRVRRTWLLGRTTGRFALLLHFSAAGAPFADTMPAGSHQQATLVYWPSAFPQRALVRGRRGIPERLAGPLPGADTVEAVLARVAEAVACQPWLDRFPCVLREAVPVVEHGEWWLQDRTGATLRLSRGDHWSLLALSGGLPVDVAGEWSGSTLAPLGLMVAGEYYLLVGEAR